MKTESHSIHDVLAKNATSFFIPPFQRAYAWGKPEIERYFSDISRIIDSDLDSKQSDKLEHFFGTIVIKEEKEGFANRSVIVDGQQRLTTTLLFLIALRDLEIDISKQDLITHNYLLNRSSTFEDKIKLKQVTKDREAYEALIKKTDVRPGVVSIAYNHLRRLINDKKKSNPQINLEHYITALQRINVAVIFLDERPFKGEDPQIIFETLNSLGRPLSLSDLIRNYILLNMESDEQTEVYEKTWHPEIEEVLNDSVSKFFRDYLQYKTNSSLKVVSDNNTKELYQQFKEYSENNFNNRLEVVKDLTRYVKSYTWIINEIVYEQISSDYKNDKTIKELLRNIFHDIKTEAFKPFVLGLLEYHQYAVGNIRMSDQTLISTLTVIRTYLIRRRTLGLTQGENKNIVTLSSRIPEIVQNQISLLDLLTTQFYGLRLPNDNEMSRGLKAMNFYEGLKKYSKFILGKIEEHNTKVAIDFRDPVVTVEHIMPQTLNENWKQELGENYGEIHKNLLHNIGNLILTEFNSEIGNKPFEEKKKKLATSSLNYRLNILDKEMWNEASIIEHQHTMINSYLETFPVPDEYRFQENWNIQISEKTIFSPQEIDAGETAEGNKPVELHILGEVVKVKTWQDVFIKFLKYLKENPDFDFDFIFDNQTDLFNREDTIVKLKRLKELLEENPKFIKRYKTFDGDFLDKIKEPVENDLFIHINISASTCISRIVNIMNKFSLDEESVKITI